MNISVYPYTTWDWDKGSEVEQERSEMTDNHISVYEPNETVITLGRRSTSIDPSVSNNIPYKVYEIDRDGGLSVHAPGHTLITANLLLTETLTKFRVYSKLAIAARKILEPIINKDITIGGEGLEVEGKRIASLGLGVKDNKTFHGLSIYFENHEIFAPFQMCSIQGVVATSVSQYTSDYNKEEISNNIAYKLVDLLS